MGEDRELWARIAGYDFDRGARVGYFAEKLAHENNWSRQYAERVIGEYRRYLYLTSCADHVVVPSDEVDMAWHQHLLDTEQYWGEFCPNVLCRPLHHRPNKGGAESDIAHVDWYERTLETYSAVFCSTPPQDVWPTAGERFGGGRTGRLAPDDDGMTSAPRVRRVACAVGAAIGLPATVAFAAPADWNHAQTVVYATFAGAIAVVLSIMLRRALLQRPADAGNVATLTDPYEVAVLNTNTQRAVNGAVAALVRDGVLAFDQHAIAAEKLKYRLVRTASLPRSAHPLERAVYQAVGQSDNGTSLTEVHSLTLPAAGRVLDSLRDRDLLRGGPALGRRLAVVCPILIVAIAYVLVATQSDDFGLGFLVIATMVLVVAAIAVSSAPPKLTTSGSDALEAVRADQPDITHVDREDVPNGRALAWVVALRGSPVLSAGSLAVLNDAIMAPANRGGGGSGVRTAGCGGGQQYSRRSGGGCGGGGGGGGAGCGGGGCGGGGCGGGG